jgi:toxin ParE1/3/4
MDYSILLDERASQDIQEAIDYYEDQQPGLGEKFENALNKQIQVLEKNPFFQLRYDNVHCLPVKKYPYMIHFTIDEERFLVIVRAVFHTSRDPKNWKH